MLRRTVIPCSRGRRSRVVGSSEADRLATSRLHILEQMALALESTDCLPLLFDILEGPVRATLGATAVHFVPSAEPSAVGDGTEASRDGKPGQKGFTAGSQGVPDSDPRDTLGALIVDLPDDKTLSPDDTTFIESVGALLGVAVESARLRERLARRMARRK
ncbi:MAG: hypothetical protein ACM3US_05920 [Sphingomonadaceae bacterium]